MKGNTAPCSRLMEVWRQGKIRRPEFVRMISGMMQEHPEAVCSILKPDIIAIESRLMPEPRGKSAKVHAVQKVPPDVAEPPQIVNSQGKPVPATLIGRLPRRDKFSLRDLK